MTEGTANVRVARVIVVCCSILAVLGGLAAPAQAAHSVPLTPTQIDDNGWITVPQSCGPSQPGLCTFEGEGIARFTGAIDGIDEYKEFFHWDPDKQVLVGDAWDRFTATIAGCGAGSFLVHQSGQWTIEEIVRMQDPTTGKVHAGDGTWTYVAGTATEGLGKMRSLWFTVRNIQFEAGTFANHEPVDEGVADC